MIIDPLVCIDIRLTRGGRWINTFLHEYTIIPHRLCQVENLRLLLEIPLSAASSHTLGTQCMGIVPMSDGFRVLRATRMT